LEKERTVTCKSCRADKQKKFTAEIAIHFPGLKGLDRPIVWVFPELLVCLKCGNAKFEVSETELRLLAKDDAATAG
jgi:predicted nucleic-acid-binding Zn-ribbon protein